MWKYKVSRSLLPVSASGSKTLSNRWLSFSPIALLFTFSLPVSFNLHQYYLGQFPANIWHNSTTIAVMPFVVLAFHASYRYLNHPARRFFIWLCIWTVLIYITKPSILPVLILILPGFALVRHGPGKVFGMTMVYAVITVLLLIWPLLFVSGGRNGNNVGGGLGIGLFEVWSLYSNSYILSVLASLLFPLVVIAVYFKDGKRDFLLQFAWAAWFVALAMYALLYETGEFMKAGNFGWQVLMASYLLFLASLVFFNRQIRGKPHLDTKAYVVMAVFLLHFVSGLVYLVKLMFLGFH
jgi:hypothetical protein